MRSIMSAGLLAMAGLAACTPSAPIKLPPPVVIAGNLDDADQATLKTALADLQADNDEGHRRIQEKLRAASGQ